MTKPGEYAVPWNAGLASSDKGSASRIKKVLDALNHIDRGIFNSEGTELPNNSYYHEDNWGHNIETDVAHFRVHLLEKLRASGWELSHKGNSDNWTVKRSKEL